MDDIGSSILSGFFRGIGYILADIFFGTICYWVGWPICKILLRGEYPNNHQLTYMSGTNSSGGWCSSVGLLILIAIGTYFISFRG